MTGFRKTVAGWLTLLAGAAPLGINATCDPRTGAFYFDRYDDDYGYGFVDWFADDYYYDDDDDYYYYYYDCCGGGIISYDEYWW